MRERCGVLSQEAIVEDFLASSWMTAEQLAACSEHGYAHYRGSLFALSPKGVVFVVRAAIKALTIVTAWKYGAPPKRRPVKRKRGRR